MKIYDKKAFLSGISMIFLGTFNVFINLMKNNVDTIIIVLFMILVVFGLNFISRSLSLKKLRKIN